VVRAEALRIDSSTRHVLHLRAERDDSPAATLSE
jgi:hypothetical protein